jgi:hypothetical protein
VIESTVGSRPASPAAGQAGGQAATPPAHHSGKSAANATGRAEARRLATLFRIVLPALLLTIPAAVLVLRGAQQLRYEELAESIRGPFWLEHRAVFDGISTNVAWYAFLALVYRVFGFGLTTARWARVALLGVSLIALSILLHRHLRRWPALAALATLAASPTLLFFNRITTSYGTDLLMLPICLLLLDQLRRQSRAPAAGGLVATAGGLGAVAMLGAMMYPALIPALPFLAVWALLALPRGARTNPALSGVAGFLLPLALASFTIRDARSLFWHPSDHGGIFRGGGVGWVPSWSVLRDNAAAIATDLFRGGSSYYFELASVDFGGVLGHAGFAAVVLLAMVTAWTLRETRPILATAAGAAALAVLSTSAAGGPPGLRRATVALAAFYLVVVVLWASAPRLTSRPWARTAIVASLLLLPLHHALAYGDHLKQAARPIWGRERVWFKAGETPQASLDRWLAHTAAGRPLDCGTLRTPGKQVCHYDYIFSAVSGWRRWNGERAVDVLAVHPRTGEIVTLSPDAWQSLALPEVRNRPSSEPSPAPSNPSS